MNNPLEGMTQEQYRALKARASFAAWLGEDRLTNEQRSAIEVYEWIHNPPQQYFIYIDAAKRTATTWTGDKLGEVRFGREYQCLGFGRPSTRVAITVKGLNGKTY